MLQFFRFRCFLVSLACLGATAAWPDSGIYAYVDDRGSINLSNDPDDVRYELFIAPAAVPDTVKDSRAGKADRMGRADRWTLYGDLVSRTAEQYRIDAALVRAVINAESGYNPNAVSRRGAGGLMQLMPATAKRFGVANVFDPAENVRGGTRYLVELLKLFDNDLRLALAAYNAGEASVLKYGKRIPPYRETTEYVSKVVAFYQQYRLSM